MGKYIIALDQGTTSSRAIIFDKEQNIIGISQKEITQIYPRPGWVEQNPMEIWATQYGVLQEVIAKSNINPSDVSAIGITNQRETTVIWDRYTGVPIYNAIVWQCRRTTNLMESLREDKELEKYINENTGLVLDSYFSASKIKWILDNVEGSRERAKKGELLFGTIDTWLVWKFTNGKAHVTDYTNASRTMLFNIKTLKWDEFLLKKFNIPSEMLPTVKNSSEIYGRITLSRDKPCNIPIASIIGDQQAALFGQNCFREGDVKNTYGTGCFMLMNTGDKIVNSQNGLVSTIAVGLKGKVQYALEGSVFSGAAVLKWLKDELKILSDEKDSEYFASKVENNNGVYVVPAFVGMGAPYWDMRARGAILGLTGGSGRNHIIRASLESIAYQCSDVLNIMKKEAQIDINELKVDGGASKNKFLMQFQADIMNSKLVKPIITETTALGAAYLAGLAVGFWKNLDEISEGFFVSETYKPKMYRAEREKYYNGWKKAVSRASNWAED